ncbi:MAG: DUF1800 family protein, partial [Planctomycetes bacterium]|nr:DUF1800 family protein [Planctomycetota bacterium]
MKELTTHVMGRLGYAGLPDEVLGVNLAPPNSQFGLLVNWASNQLFVTQPIPTDLTNAIASLSAGAEPTALGAPTAHGWTVSELASKRILMAAFSPNQLRERMANFWRTLFNTHFRIPEVYFT